MIPSNGPGEINSNNMPGQLDADAYRNENRSEGKDTEIEEAATKHKYIDDDTAPENSKNKESAPNKNQETKQY